MKNKILIAFAFASISVVAFTVNAQHHGHKKADAVTADAAAKSPPLDVTLLQVMQYLGQAEAKIQFGLLSNNRLLIQSGAHDILNHPAPKGGIKPYIKKPTAGLQETIKAMDKIVHENAARLESESSTLPMLELKKLNDEITNGCITCHNAFRD